MKKAYIKKQLRFSQAMKRSMKAFSHHKSVHSDYIPPVIKNINSRTNSYIIEALDNVVKAAKPRAMRSLLRSVNEGVQSRYKNITYNSPECYGVRIKMVLTLTKFDPVKLDDLEKERQSLFTSIDASEWIY